MAPFLEYLDHHAKRDTDSEPGKLKEIMRQERPDILSWSEARRYARQKGFKSEVGEIVWEGFKAHARR